jgi:hypothetical protein
MPQPSAGLPSTRDEARAMGLDRYFTGIPCRHGHVAARYVSRGGHEWGTFTTLLKRWHIDPMRGTAVVSVLSMAIFVPPT